MRCKPTLESTSACLALFNFQGPVFSKKSIGFFGAFLTKLSVSSGAPFHFTSLRPKSIRIHPNRSAIAWGPRACECAPLGVSCKKGVAFPFSLKISRSLRGLLRADLCLVRAHQLFRRPYRQLYHLTKSLPACQLFFLFFLFLFSLKAVV